MVPARLAKAQASGRDTGPIEAKQIEVASAGLKSKGVV